MASSQARQMYSFCDNSGLAKGLAKHPKKCTFRSTDLIRATDF